MTNIVCAIVGSGTYEQIRGILPSGQRGSQPNGEGVRYGVQTIVANPEDFTSVDAFAASGISVGTSPIEIVGPNSNPLPRCRQIVLQNTGSNEVHISHRPNFTLEDSFELPVGGTAGANRRITLPLLHNVSIWARTDSGTSQIRMLIF